MLAHRRAGAPPQRARGQRGETLIEVMIAVMLLGLVMTVILGGLFTLVSVSDSNQERTKVSIAVQAYAEQIKQPVGDLAYIPCGSVSAYEAKLTTAGIASSLPDGYKATIAVTYWSGGSGYGTTCTVNAATGTDLGLQRFVITVDNQRTGAAKVTEALVVIKRDARCPNPLDYSNPDAGPC